MTQREAEALAATVRAFVERRVGVESEGRYSVVTVAADSGNYTLRDDADWRWLSSRIESR